MFEPDKLYNPRDTELNDKIAGAGVLGQWRMKGKGPRYLKIGGRVWYRGRDLNDWLASRVVETRDTRPSPPQAAA